MSSPYVSLLEAVRAHCNLPDFPTPLPSNQLVLELENGLSLTIDFEEATSMVVLFAELGVYEKEQELAVLLRVVEANFLWVATSGATLSVRPDLQSVYLALHALETTACLLDPVSYLYRHVERLLASCRLLWRGFRRYLLCCCHQCPFESLN